MLQLLEQELDADLSELKSRVDVDITCDTAVDSLNMVNIVADLEDELGIEIEDADIVPSRMRSLEKFADFLANKVAANNAEQSVAVAVSESRA
jgi:acyl carrier protein